MALSVVAACVPTYGPMVTRFWPSAVVTENRLASTDSYSRFPSRGMSGPDSITDPDLDHALNLGATVQSHISTHGSYENEEDGKTITVMQEFSRIKPRQESGSAV